MRDLKLRVNGEDFSGWKRAQVTRSLEAVCGSFDLAVFDRWSETQKRWPIVEEDECALFLGDDQVLKGYVDKRSISFSATSHSLRVSGRDQAGALVDCSADLGRWEFVNASVLKLAEKLCDPFGISVRLQSGLAEPKPVAKLTIDPGESAFEALERACRVAALLPVSDGDGGILLCRAGAGRCSSDLVEGENILEASGEYDATGRFSAYRVLGQGQATDNDWGLTAAAPKGTAIDEGVRRIERKLIVRAESAITAEQAKQRAAWESTVRAARAQSVNVSVQGWEQKDGSLWALNALVYVKSPRLGIDADMLVVETTFSTGEDGSTTRLSLRRPDAFKPEPVTIPRGTAPWAEIARGVK